MITMDLSQNACGGNLTVEWIVSDGCGAADSTTAMIILAPDATTPTFVNLSSDITVNVDVDNCESSVVFSTPIGTDCNQPVSVTQVANGAGDLLLSGSEFPVGTTTIVFQAEDNCGNTVLDSFDITVVDFQQPSLDCPQDITVCNDADACFWTADMTTDPIFADNCDGIDLSYTISGETNTSGDSLVRLDNVQFELGLSTIIYSLTDTMGNTITCAFDVLVEDCQAPSITCPPSGDLILECANAGINDSITAWIATVSFSDNCPDSTIMNSVSFVESMCGNTETRIYTFTTTDAAGNTAICTSNVIIADTTAPIVTLAMDETVECDGEGNNADLLSWLSNNGGATGSDLCGNVTWTNDYTGLSNGCGNTGSALVTFTATDDCGNTSITQATFNIQDITDPVLVLPTALTLECDNSLNEEIIQSWLSQAYATDQCGDAVVTNNGLSTFAEACGLTGTYTVQFTATDDCGRTTISTQTITIIDTTNPLITAEATDLIIECTMSGDYSTEINNWLDLNGNAVASDGCSGPVFWSTPVAGSLVDECGNTSTTLYTFMVSDSCSNTATTTASVIIIDETAPILTEPMDITVQCEDMGATTVSAWIATAIAADSCGTASVTNEIYNTISGCGNTDETIYLFTATDLCGNTSTAFASYKIEDDTIPTIIAPADLNDNMLEKQILQHKSCNGLEKLLWLMVVVLQRSPQIIMEVYQINAVAL